MSWAFLLSCLCALLVGYSINQGGTCGVASARALVEQGRIDGFIGFAVATGAAGVVCLQCVEARPRRHLRQAEDPHGLWFA